MAILNSKITFATPTLVGVSNYLPTFAINQNYNYFSADSCLKQKL